MYILSTQGGRARERDMEFLLDLNVHLRVLWVIYCTLQHLIFFELSFNKLHFFTPPKNTNKKRGVIYIIVRA